MQVWADGSDSRYFLKHRNGRHLVDGNEPVTPEAQLWNGYAASLKTLWEPIVIRPQTIGYDASNFAFTHGTGALNLKPCRVGDEVRRNHRGAGCPHYVSGRWPSNLIIDEVAGCEIERQGGSASFFYCGARPPQNRRETLIP